MDQGVVALARLHDHIATFASVSAGRPTPWNKFFAAEGEAAVAAVAGLHTNYRLIYEHVLGWIRFNSRLGSNGERPRGTCTYPVYRGKGKAVALQCSGWQYEE
jgi:hypothetical protein